MGVQNVTPSFILKVASKRPLLCNIRMPWLGAPSPQYGESSCRKWERKHDLIEIRFLDLEHPPWNGVSVLFLKNRSVSLGHHFGDWTILNLILKLGMRFNYFVRSGYLTLESAALIVHNWYGMLKVRPPNNLRGLANRRLLMQGCAIK